MEYDVFCFNNTKNMKRWLWTGVCLCVCVVYHAHAYLLPIYLSFIFHFFISLSLYLLYLPSSHPAIIVLDCSTRTVFLRISWFPYNKWTSFFFLSRKTSLWCINEKIFCFQPNLHMTRFLYLDWGSNPNLNFWRSRNLTPLSSVLSFKVMHSAELSNFNLIFCLLIQCLKVTMILNLITRIF